MILKLKDGEVKIELFSDIAPSHVERIKTLADDGKYDNVVFHRVIDGFMAQTGDVQFGNSSSEKFNSFSTSDSKSRTLNLSDFNVREAFPLKCSRLISEERRPLEEINAATASACTKSTLPFKNERSENSPGSAMRAPPSMAALIIDLLTARPPWQEISITSSPVKLFGDP